MIATRSASRAITESWCEMKIIVSPRSRRISSQQVEDLRLDRDVERADRLVGDQQLAA